MPMQCKLLGFCLLIVCGYLVGDSLALAVRRQEALLREYRLALALMVQMVSEGLSSRDIWLKLLEREDSFPEMQLSRSDSLREYRLPGLLPLEINRELDKAFDEIGCLSKEALMEKIRSKRRFSDEILQDIVRKRCKAEGLYRKVSLLCALALAILLL